MGEKSWQQELPFVGLPTCQLQCHTLALQSPERYEGNRSWDRLKASREAACSVPHGWTLAEQGFWPVRFDPWIVALMHANVSITFLVGEKPVKPFRHLLVPVNHIFFAFLYHFVPTSLRLPWLRMEFQSGCPHSAPPSPTAPTVRSAYNWGVQSPAFVLPFRWPGADLIWQNEPVDWWPCSLEVPWRGQHHPLGR